MQYYRCGGCGVIASGTWMNRNYFQVAQAVRAISRCAGCGKYVNKNYAGVNHEQWLAAGAPNDPPNTVGIEHFIGPQGGNDFDDGPAVVQEAKPNEGVVPDNVKPLNLDHLFGKIKNRIYRVGVEVEGGWTVHPGTEPHHDGSVFKEGVPPNCPPLAAKGEISSPPIEPALIRTWVKKFHPQVVDASCGLHIHMGLKSVNYYSALMDDPAYQATLLTYLKAWGKEHGIAKEHTFWTRLEGKCKHCKAKWWPELQAIKTVKEVNVERDGNKRGNRYTIINFCWSLNDMQTVEVRVLPMFPTPDLSVSALNCVVDVTNAYLAATAPRALDDRKKQRVEVDVKLNPDDPGIVRNKRVRHV